LNRYPYPIPSREDILALFRGSRKKPLTAAAISSALSVKRTEIDGLVRRLNAMQRDGQLHFSEEKGYALASTRFIAGQVSVHPDGYGFLLPDEGGDDIFLGEKEMQKVMPGDRVQVRVIATGRRGEGSEGTIVEVLSRACTHVVGRLAKKDGVWLLEPEDRRIIHDIMLDKAPSRGKPGQFVNAELVTQPSHYAPPLARVVEVLGDADSAGVEIEIAVRKFGLPYLFSEATLAQVGTLPDTVGEEEVGGRVDLRDIPLVTIDGEDARDFDDAVYCEPIPGGKGKKAGAHRLIVAIADVSHYVKPTDAIDADALLRSTSVYFPRRVIPMLPEKLSNRLCSLNPDVDRLAMVCDMVVSGEGVLEAYQFYPALIHSAARLTYTAAAAVIANPGGPEAIIHAAIAPQIHSLYAAYLALKKARELRGAIDFETVETYIVSNEAGRIEKILPRVRNEAHKLIEECMLAANVSAADFLIRHHQSCLFRVHATPTTEKLDQLRAFLAPTGLSLTGGAKPQSLDYAALLKRAAGRPDAGLLQTMLLRSMPQAVYSPDNAGHFGLAYSAYTHFTSPIRRYPDLLVHRAIKAILRGGRYKPEGVDTSRLNRNPSSAMRRQKRVQADDAGNEKKDTIWHALGLHCSVNERRADEASRDVESWLKCYFIRDRLGEHFSGTVSGVASFGIFIQLDEVFVEGLVHITDLGRDFYRFDEIRNELRGERTGECYRLTDRVVVQLARVNMDSRQIDLVLVRNKEKKGTAKDTASAPLFGRYKQRSIASLEATRKYFHEASPDGRKGGAPTQVVGSVKKKSGGKSPHTKKRKRTG
jgi:ribonuclease R